MPQLLTLACHSQQVEANLLPLLVVEAVAEVLRCGLRQILQVGSNRKT